jgi:hypothetical protein
MGRKSMKRGARKSRNSWNKNEKVGGSKGKKGRQEGIVAFRGREQNFFRGKGIFF